MQTSKTYYSSPIGWIEIVGTPHQIVTLDFVEDESAGDERLPLIIQECVRQIDEYFSSKRKKFSMNLLLKGTEFQKVVWGQLQKIPFGKTVSYREVAAAIGKPTAYRAVGAANGKNPISIIVPCHRVIGSGGSLTGYGGGLWRKEWLLKHERAML